MLDRFLRFSYAIYEIQHCWNKIAAESMGLYGLKGSYALYLITLRLHSEGITAAQLGSICGRDKADVSRAAAILESKGLLQKQAGSSNLYRAKLVLTDYGNSITDEILKSAEFAEERAGEGLDEQSRSVLYEALDKVIVNMRRLSKEGLPTGGAENLAENDEISTTDKEQHHEC